MPLLNQRWGLFDAYIGSVPVHVVSGSILIKGANTIAGGADTKSNGGQIFE